MLFTINFDQTRKMKQEEAAKNNACFGRSFCHDKNRSRYSGMGKKEGQISSPVCKGIIWVRLFFLMFVDVHMANMDSIFFRGSLLYLCFFVFVCSWLPGP